MRFWPRAGHFPSGAGDAGASGNRQLWSEDSDSVSARSGRHSSQ
jgi:hypothetical protein